MYGTLYYVTAYSHSPIKSVVCNKRVQCNVTYICFLLEHVLEEIILKVSYEIQKTVSRCFSFFEINNTSDGKTNLTQQVPN